MIFNACVMVNMPSVAGVLQGKHISCLHAHTLVAYKVVEVQFGLLSSWVGIKMREREADGYKSKQPTEGYLVK